MNYYKTKGDTLIGTIDLKTATDVLPNNKNQGKNAFGFEIRTPDRIWFLYAETQTDQETWIAHIRDVLNTQRYTTVPHSSGPLTESRPRGTAVATNDIANGEAEPPQVPQKPSFQGKLPPKLPPKKMSPGIPKAMVGSSSGPTLPAKKGGPPPMPRGFGNSAAPSMMTSSSPNLKPYGDADNSASGDGQTSPGTPKARPPLPKGSSAAAFKKMAPSPPPRPPAPASDDIVGPSPGFSKRRNSAFRATTGDLPTTPNGHTPVQSHSGTLRPGTSTPSSPSLSPHASATPASTNPDKRTKTAKEVLQTEVYYVDCLTSLRDDYQVPLISGARAGDGYTEADITTMFSSTLPMIIPVNETLKARLEEKMNSFDPFTTVVGDVFVAIGPFLKIYLEYSRNYQAAIDTYNRLKENPNFLAKIQSGKEKSVTKLALEHLLIMPVQRIPRYLLLLGELKRETGTDHPDRVLLEKAIDLIESVANHINEQMKRLEVSSKTLAYPELVAPHRYLMWEGNIETRIDKEKEEAKFVLFNDMLLHTPAKKATKGSKWHLMPESVCSIQLVWTAAATFQVKESSASIGPVEAIDLIIPAKRMTVVASTVDERNFLKALREAIQRHHGSELAPNDREADHVFSEESTYRGSWREGKPHGTGTMEYKGIATYSGGWIMGLKQGQGSMAWMSGNTYDGFWMAGLPHGEGTFAWPNRDTYAGSFIEGLKSGTGTFKWASGATYSGDWVKDKPSGNGTYESAVEFYEGSWLDGFFHGVGTFREKLTGRTYSGAWANGQREGAGTCRYADGSEYSGAWKRNRRDGKGTLTTRLGKGVETYTGDWVEDRRNGVGVLTTADGAVYEGTFKDDARHGKGKLKFADNDSGIRLRYEGEFDLDRMAGKGILWFQNGDMYDGSFKDNAFNGQGSFQYASSIKVEGKWANGQLEGKGSIFQLLSPTDKKPTHLTGTFSHGSFVRSKDAATKFDIPVAPASTTINTTRL